MSKLKTVSICSILIVITVAFVVTVSVKNRKIASLWQKTTAVEASVSYDMTYEAAEGNYSVSVTAVYETAPDTDEASPPEAERVVVVVYEYKNDDIKNGLVIGSSHFKAYDKSGKELEEYPQKNLFEPGEIGEEGTHTASVAFALNNSENFIELEYYNDISSGNPDCVYKETW